MMRVMEHPFFQGRDLDAATLEEIKQQTARILEIGEEQRTELARTREILLKGIFEATEVTTPTAFVVLREKLPPPPTTREPAELQELLASGGEVADQWKGRLDEGIEWLQGLRAFGSSGAADSEGNSDSVFEKIREAFSSLVSGPVMYLYLLDELTGEPVIPADGSYPITISTPAALVPRLLPLMQSWREGAQLSVELLKQESSAEAFGTVHRAAMRTDDGEQRATVRGESLRQLRGFLRECDPAGAYAGLRRVGDEEGTAVWTILQESAIQSAIKSRAAERAAEEQRHEHLVAAAMRRWEKATAASAPARADLGTGRADEQPPHLSWYGLSSARRSGSSSS